MELLLALVSFDPTARATPLDVLQSTFMTDLIETGTSCYSENDIVKSYTAYSTNSHDDDSPVLEDVLVRNPDASSSSDDDDALSSEEEEKKEEVETTTMPSKTKRMINPRRGGGDGGGGGAAAHQQGYDPTLVGKRTGVTVPPRGQVTFDSPSSGNDVLFENPDAFFAAAQSGKKRGGSALSAGGSDDDGDGRCTSPRRKKGGRRGVGEDKKERCRREREEFEEEARQNAARRPDILQEKEDGTPRSKVSSLALDIYCNFMDETSIVQFCSNRRMRS